MPNPRRSAAFHLLPWLAGLLVFYGSWFILVLKAGGWAVLQEHAGIAIAMAAGSYFAGSTPLGGGTVGFPVLVLLFHEPATLGRDFSFAVQSVGMTSAALFILCRRTPMEWHSLSAALVGSLIGTPLGIFFFAPLASPLFIKVFFAIVWAAFGILHLMRLRELSGFTGISTTPKTWLRRMGFGVGLVGGFTVAAVTGVGVDLLLYAALALIWRADLRLSIPASVILMAFTSLVAVATKQLTIGFTPGVYENWLAAAPVVALGAPLGAFIVARLGRRIALWIVSLLCVGQFIWMIQQNAEALGLIGLLASCAAVALLVGVFLFAFACGRRLAGMEGRSVASGSARFATPQSEAQS